MDENLDFTTVTANVTSRCSWSKAKGLLKSNTYTKLYDTCVLPIMNYASGVWGYRRYDKPNTVHNRAIRSFLGVHRYSSNVAIQGDVGWKWPIVHRKLEMLKLFRRIFLMSNESLTRQIMKWDWQHKGRTWSWCVRDILKETSQHNVCYKNFEEYNNVDFNSVLDKAEIELMRIEVKRWQSELDKQQKLRTYKLFKESFQTEVYVQINMPKSTRSFIAQLRSGVLPLSIETGRFLNLKVEERLCRFCENNAVEDELHFLFNCPLYTTLRIEFYNQVNRFLSIDALNDAAKLKVLMNDKRVINRFGTFIKNCFH